MIGEMWQEIVPQLAHLNHADAHQRQRPLLVTAGANQAASPTSQVSATGQRWRADL